MRANSAARLEPSDPKTAASYCYMGSVADHDSIDDVPVDLSLEQYQTPP